MKRALLLLLVVTVGLTGCAGARTSGGDGPVDVPFEELVADPGDFDGRTVRLRAFYLSSFETSVLTDRLAESYPPQAGSPSVWVGAGPPAGGCIEQPADVAPAAWGEVVATGRFRYQEGGGFGHLGEWEMTLESAVLTCPKMN